ncbi:NAD dependent epimerase/dehydratase [Aspergillus pseudonomiae]|uniref:NAD dependent epimerase/dehydratase n=1 Tax=Aspergillus pseudonomiae TaxID=1506151 RepID=A0A5N7CXM9_9EURO|nr:NAD dependent epimerase/dehydratase [Aspergillus pseudonomiae]KAE8398921.1 NAD dependent epimerase/dehydratase [Aspergillus pseudonomiae]
MGQQPSTPYPGTKIQVIGAGLPRTGTASFSAALNILLHRPIYHAGTQTTMGPPIEIQSWIRILRHWLSPNPQDRQLTLQLLEQRLDGYAAITDSPGAQLVPELLELYPDAKVICTVRDPDAWAKSIDQVRSMATLWFLRVILLPVPGMRHFVEYIHLIGAQWVRLYATSMPDRQTYELHIEWLKQVVPADRLVFFHVGDGWEPLCEALGVEVPVDVPFPRINDSEAIARTGKYHIQQGLMRWVGIGSVVGVVVAAVAMRSSGSLFW